MKNAQVVVAMCGTHAAYQPSSEPLQLDDTLGDVSPPVGRHRLTVRHPSHGDAQDNVMPASHED